MGSKVLDFVLCISKLLLLLLYYIMYFV